MTPRLGFVGAGWIGRNRMEAVVRSGAATAAAVADVSPVVADEAAASVGASAVPVGDLLAEPQRFGVDGIVIATPSALHAEQAIAALSQGVAVFCQKPLGRTAAECEAVVEAARQADRLLAVDLSYRHLAAVDAVRRAVATGSVGDLYAADLVFHNAYGPDKGWFTDPALSGGGCVIDLGVHLVDLALWMLDGAGSEVAGATSRLYSNGRPLEAVGEDVVEDHAVARVDLDSGATFTLACSWFLHAGRDAVISATFHGSEGAVAVENVGGSFYDFRAYERHGTSESVLAEPPDEWGGRAIVDWAQRLGAGAGFDPSNDEVIAAARVIDRIYGR